MLLETGSATSRGKTECPIYGVSLLSFCKMFIFFMKLFIVIKIWNKTTRLLLAPRHGTDKLMQSLPCNLPPSCWGSGGREEIAGAGEADLQGLGPQEGARYPGYLGPPRQRRRSAENLPRRVRYSLPL